MSARKCIIESVEEQVLRAPDRSALEIEASGTNVSYKELGRLTAELSAIVSTVLESAYSTSPDHGTPTPLVAVMADRNVGIVVSMLGILKSGAAYVPVDPSFPPDRQAYILSHSTAQILIVDDQNEHSLKSWNIEIPCLIRLDSSTGVVLNKEELQKQFGVAAFTSNHQATRFKPNMEGLQYVLYTSGSTGKPKGVMVLNKGVQNVVQHYCNDLCINASDKVLCLTTFCFDISMLELFMPLVRGATCVLASAKTQKDPYRILNLLRNSGVTIMQATPTTYEMLLATGWRGDRTVRFLVGGEAFRPLLSQIVSNCKSMHNVYGPTETSIWSSSYEFDVHQDFAKFDVKNGGVPIGKPISNTSFYILDPVTREPLEDGVEGELWIGGEGVALGYVHAPELTAERFVPDPYWNILFPFDQINNNNPRMYRTGDVVKKLADGSGNFVFGRRIDDQVKVNGYRIELSEIELAFLGLPEVAQCVVIVRDGQLHGFIQLKSQHFITDDTEKQRMIANMKQQVSRMLTHYMIPRYMMIVDDFPQTANGKLDKKNLPIIPASTQKTMTGTVQSKVSEAKTTTALQTQSMVEYVSNMVRTVNGVYPSRGASFAALGVDSFAAVLFRNMLSEGLGSINISAETIYDPNMTVEKFAVYIYNRLQAEKPQILKDRNILTAVATTNAAEGPLWGDEGEHEHDIESGDSTELERDGSLGSAQMLTSTTLLSNRRLVEGLRGFLSLLVLIDHFFMARSDVYGYRVRADTLLFLITTGFTMSLQNLARVEMGNNSWDTFQFLKSRFIGMFPIYYLALALDIYRVTLTPMEVPSQYQPLFWILSVLGLQTWTQWMAAYIHDLYYVSLLWGVFLVYAAYKATYHSKLSNAWKGVVAVGITAALGGLYAYHSGGGTNPPWGCIYFLMGVVFAHGFQIIRKYISINESNPINTEFSTPPPSIEMLEAKPTYSTKDSVSQTLRSATTRVVVTVDADVENGEHVAVPESKWSIIGLAHRNSRYLLWLFLPDILAFFIVFLIFYNSYGTRNSPQGEEWYIRNGQPANVPKHGSLYLSFDYACRLAVLPLLYSALLMVLFLQPVKERISIFAKLLSEWPVIGDVMVLIGECSLPIYILQRDLVEFWFNTILGLIQNGTWRPLSGNIQFHLKYYIPAIILAVIVGILVQKVFQDRWVASLQLYFMQNKSLNSSNISKNSA